MIAVWFLAAVFLPVKAQRKTTANSRQMPMRAASQAVRSAGGGAFSTIDELAFLPATLISASIWIGSAGRIARNAGSSVSNWPFCTGTDTDWRKYACPASCPLLTVMRTMPETGPPLLDTEPRIFRCVLLYAVGSWEANSPLSLTKYAAKDTTFAP